MPKTTKESGSSQRQKVCASLMGGRSRRKSTQAMMNHKAASLRLKMREMGSLGSVVTPENGD